MILNFSDYLNEAFIGNKFAPDARNFDIEVIDPLENEITKEIIFKNNHTDEDIKKMNKFLKDNKYKALKLFHGTSAKFDIMDKGLLTTKTSTKKSMQSQTGYVYLSIFKDMAKKFGDIAYPYNDIAVYTVEVQIINLKPDKDQIRNKRLWGGVSSGETLADSMLYGHGFRVKGDIPPYMIKDKEIVIER